jgi:hypothetical protein
MPSLPRYPVPLHHLAFPLSACQSRADTSRNPTLAAARDTALPLAPKHIPFHPQRTGRGLIPRFLWTTPAGKARDLKIEA